MLSLRAARWQISTSEAIVDIGTVATAYPEWDGPRGRYRPNWCTVVESDVRADVDLDDPAAERAGRAPVTGAPRDGPDPLQTTGAR